MKITVQDGDGSRVDRRRLHLVHIAIVARFGAWRQRFGCTEPKMRQSLIGRTVSLSPDCLITAANIIRQWLYLYSKSAPVDYSPPAMRQSTAKSSKIYVRFYRATGFGGSNQHVFQAPEGQDYRFRPHK
jgi:hypothetical protein